LRDPAQSIPRGTVTAHLSTTTLYFVFIILFGAAGTRAALTDTNVIVAAEVAWPVKWVVSIGIIMSSTGAAL
jgi:amino acid transporter